MHGRVALVTDSTSCIPAELAAHTGDAVGGRWAGKILRHRRGAHPDALERNAAVSTDTGMSLGYAVPAARVAGAGGGPRRVMDALARRLDGSSELIYVDTLEYLRRGGRIGAAAAMVGSALSMKPLLTMADGKVARANRVLDRLHPRLRHTRHHRGQLRHRRPRWTGRGGHLHLPYLGRATTIGETPS